jgi:hypothetical protein
MKVALVIDSFPVVSETFILNLIMGMHDRWVEDELRN